MDPNKRFQNRDFSSVWTGKQFYCSPLGRSKRYKRKGFRCRHLLPTKNPAGLSLWLQGLYILYSLKHHYHWTPLSHNNFLKILFPLRVSISHLVRYQQKNSEFSLQVSINKSTVHRPSYRFLFSFLGIKTYALSPSKNML